MLHGQQRIEVSAALCGGTEMFFGFLHFAGLPQTARRPERGFGAQSVTGCAIARQFFKMADGQINLTEAISGQCGVPIGHLHKIA